MESLLLPGEGGGGVHNHLHMHKSNEYNKVITYLWGGGGGACAPFASWTHRYIPQTEKDYSRGRGKGDKTKRNKGKK